MMSAPTGTASRTRLIQIAGVLTVGLISTAAYGQSNTASSTIATNDVIRRVWDTNLFLALGKTIYWIDDSTLLVAGTKEPPAMEVKKGDAPTLYVWRLGEPPRPHSAQPVAAAFAYCGARGQAAFLQGGTGDGKSEDGKFIQGVWWAGPLGQEKEIGKVNIYPTAPPLITRLRGLLVRIEPIDCEYHPDPSMEGLSYVADSERRYYLVFGKSGSPTGASNSDQLVLMRSDKSAQTVLPIKRSEVSQASYRAFDGTFLLFRTVLSAADKKYNHTENYFQTWQDTNCRPVWRVDPKSAKTDRLCIPYGPWVGDKEVPRPTQGYFEAFATKAGHYFTFQRVLGPDGLYRFDDGTVRQVIKGTVFRATVSPSGCRLAFFHHPESNQTPSRLVAIDLCV
jgi:hypothetical protein